MGGALGNRADVIKHYNKSKHKWNKELKTLNNKNKMIYRITKNSGSRREINHNKKIKEKAPKKRSYSSSDSPSSDLDYDSSLSSDSDRE